MTVAFCFRHKPITIALMIALLSSCGGEGDSSASTSDAGISSSNSIDNLASNTSQLGEVADGIFDNIINTTRTTAITYAVAREGQIIYEKAYGFQDAAKTIPLTPDALMRTASIIKPVTAAAVRKLVSSGNLSLSDHVFCTGSNNPCWLPADLISSTDVRIEDITIQHLISHEGGWYSDVSGDPGVADVAIRDALLLTSPPTRTDIVRYVMARPLDYTPGNPNPSGATRHQHYSNFGYMLLGLIIEQASHESYTHFVQTHIMAQMGIPASDFKAGASRLADRDSREAVYMDNSRCPSVFNRNQSALCNEELVDANNWLSVGLSITTARAMALFAQHYLLPGNAIASSSGLALEGWPNTSGLHRGGFYGISTIIRQLPSGISYAVFINSSAAIDPEIFDRVSQLPP